MHRLSVTPSGNEFQLAVRAEGLMKSCFSGHRLAIHYSKCYSCGAVSYHWSSGVHNIQSFQPHSQHSSFQWVQCALQPSCASPLRITVITQSVVLVMQAPHHSRCGHLITVDAGTSSQSMPAPHRSRCGHLIAVDAGTSSQSMRAPHRSRCGHLIAVDAKVASRFNDTILP